MSKEKSELLEFFRKIGDATIKIKNGPQYLKKGLKKLKRGAQSPDKTVPSYLHKFFHQRHAGWPEYVMLKTQITIILLFGFAAALILTNGPWLIFGPVLLLLSFYAITLTKFQLKAAFQKDYPAYRGLTGICIGLAWGSSLLLEYFPRHFENILLKAALPVTIVVIAAISAFIGLRIKYGRSYTYGVVEETKDNKAKVRIGYDLRSNVKQGLHFLDSFIKVEEGDIVKVKVDRSTLGLRGSTAEAITEKASGKHREFSIST